MFDFTSDYPSVLPSHRNSKRPAYITTQKWFIYRYLVWSSPLNCRQLSFVFDMQNGFVLIFIRFEIYISPEKKEQPKQERTRNDRKRTPFELWTIQRFANRVEVETIGIRSSLTSITHSTLVILILDDDFNHEPNRIASDGDDVNWTFTVPLWSDHRLSSINAISHFAYKLSRWLITHCAYFAPYVSLVCGLWSTCERYKLTWFSLVKPNTP